MRLDVEPLRRVVILATNIFATLGRDGSIKRKGGRSGATWTRSTRPTALVVADAVAAALLRDVPPERTVRACTDPVRFCRVTPASRPRCGGPSWSTRPTARKSELPKVTRWYKARDSTLKIRHDTDEGRTPPRSTPSASASPWTWPRAGCRGPRSVLVHRPGPQGRPGRPRLPPPLAEAAWATTPGPGGPRPRTVPCPKRGKAQPAGSTRRSADLPLGLGPVSRPSGPTPGPTVGILVLDVDERGEVPEVGRQGQLAPVQGPLERPRRLPGLLPRGGDAEGVRRGQARGKLIFRLEADARPSAGEAGDRPVEEPGRRRLLRQGDPLRPGRASPADRLPARGDARPRPRIGWSRG